MRITIIITFSTCILQALSKDNEPFLQIQDVNNPDTTVEPVIRVERDQGLVLKCLLLNCDKCNDHRSVYWNSQLKKSRYLNLQNVDKENSYACLHPTRNLTVNVTVSVVNRTKRHDYFRKNYGDLNKKTDEDLLDSWKWPGFNADIFPSQDSDHWNKDLDDLKLTYDDIILSGETYPPKEVERTQVNMVVVIGIFIGAIIVVMSIGICCLCTAKKNRPQPSMSRPRQENTRELRSSHTEPLPVNYRPIETNIPSYPARASTNINESSAPPPSYEEAMSSLRTNGFDLKPSAPQL